jgi:hypothetical protein
MLISALFKHPSKLQCLTQVAPRQYSTTIYKNAVVKSSEQFSILTILGCLKLFSTLIRRILSLGGRATPIYLAIF